ncbi:nitrate reductase, putative [Trypanosoma cruzi marinkellei]|uniref:Nitrate reductase, putative n=1 Tax=Trypanosoma cruzi marinkellei TaxID=85056 RepID=K2PA27_TRYCR|nr:nitrate reductase, putative [Trypanosoma cruzi marinkellei]
MGGIISKKSVRDHVIDGAVKGYLNKAQGKKVEAPDAATAATTKQTAKTPSRAIGEAQVKNMITKEGRDIVIIHGKVYDVTSFTASHPGGEAAIKSNVGKEAGETFESMHGSRAHEKLEEFLLGPLEVAPSVLTEFEVQRRISEGKRALLIIHGYVYDVTDFVASHPGGEAAIMSKIGEEVGEMFERIHGKTTKELAKDFIVGRLSSTKVDAKDAAPESPAASKAVTETKVLKSVDVAVDIKNITFSCPEKLRMLPGGHISVLVPDGSSNGFIKVSHYTPFVCEATSFTITVKKYPNGMTSSYLHSLKPGDTMKYEGPLRPNWVVEEDEALMKEQEEKRHVLLIAGGVGITPIYAMVEHLLKNQIASVTLVASYQVPEVMLLRNEFASLVEKYGKGAGKDATEGEEVNVSPRNTFELHYVFTRTKEAPNLPETGNVHLGRFGVEVMKQLSPTVSCVICGPPSFADGIAKELVSNNICNYQQVHVL